MMRHLKTLWCGVVALLVALSGCVQSSSKSPGTSAPGAPVVLVSVDGLIPKYILAADEYGLRIPTLRRLLKEGTYARGVKGVVPTLTYPSHVTLITGVSPAGHGVVNNYWFDPERKNKEGWYWYAEDISVPTLWDVAREADMVTANVDWPVSVGADVTFNLPQFWRAENDQDPKLLRALSTPGLMDEVEKAVGPLLRGGDYGLTGDKLRVAYACYLLKAKHPQFMTVYLGSLDMEEHYKGPYAPAVFRLLEEIDKLLADLWSAAKIAGNGRAYLCVVSDHGFAPIDKEVRLNVAFREAGLIEVDDMGTLVSWQAYAWKAHGSAAIRLADPGDAKLRARVRAVLDRLAEDARYGIDRIVEGAQGSVAGGFPRTAFVIGAKPGFTFSSETVVGPAVVDSDWKGTHGFLPENEAMDASFFIVGPGIKAGRDLGRIDMLDIAPTLAHLLNVSLRNSRGSNLLK